jgi:hypothetical protein
MTCGAINSHIGAVGTTVLALSTVLCAGASVTAQSETGAMRLVVAEGTPLRVAVERRVVITHVDQPIEGIVVEPVFAYDRIVIPAGARVLGHVARRASVSKKRRTLAMLGGDFTPLHDILLEFDTIVFSDGRQLPVRTEVSRGTEQVSLQLAAGAETQGNVASRATEEITQQAKRVMAILEGPGKVERMQDAGLRALPYHPEFFSRGTVFDARLTSPIEFGAVAPTPRAGDGIAPAPESILAARLLTSVDSAHATKGTTVEAATTRPVFSAAHELILPAGARLTGHVTSASHARHFRRNGQLRFLFDTVQIPDRESVTLLASLYAVEAGRAERIAVDEEGGTTSTNSSTRFIAPALGALALVGLSQGHLETDTDGAGPEMQYGGPVSGSVAGLIGASVTGLAVSTLGRPAALALGIAGVARTTYGAVFAKGREVAFPADTRIQVQLAPAPRASKPDVRRGRDRLDDK